nr:hypothetical protein [Microbacterium bovistercoris]
MSRLYPACDRCGMPSHLVATRAHLWCDRQRRKEDRRRDRQREREARDWIATNLNQ